MISKSEFHALREGDVVNLQLVEAGQDRADRLDDDLLGARFRAKIHLKRVQLLGQRGSSGPKMMDAIQRTMVLFPAGNADGLREIREDTHLLLPDWAIESVEVVERAR